MVQKLLGNNKDYIISDKIANDVITGLTSIAFTEYLSISQKYRRHRGLLKNELL
jgi:hypothetical protein